MEDRKRVKVPKGFLLLVETHRMELRLSLRETAKRAGWSVSFLSRVLTGRRGLPSKDDIVKLAKALEIDPRRLLFEAGHVPKRTLPLLRATNELSASELKEVIAKAEELIRKRKAERRRES